MPSKAEVAFHRDQYDSLNHNGNTVLQGNPDYQAISGLCMRNSLVFLNL